MAEPYLSNDPQSGEPLPRGYLSMDPGAGASLEGRPQLDARGRPIVSSNLSDAEPSALLQMLQGAAHPQSLGDLLALVIPGNAHGVQGLVDTAKVGGQVLRDATMDAPSLSKLPLTILQKLTKRAFPPEVTPTAMSPRLASKAPTVEQAITDALNEARQAPKPSKVSLPGGDTYRAEGAVPRAPAATSPASAPASAAPKTAAAAPSTPAPPPGPVPRQAAMAAKLKLSPKEFEAFQGLVEQGYPPEKVLQAIQGQRAASALAGRLGTPTDAEVGAAVADRNATGRWPQDRR
jgi:hypothetical protein